MFRSSVMKFATLQLLAGLVFLALSPEVFATGGGSVVGNGGGSLVCFKKTPAAFVENGLLLKNGRYFITSAVSLEYFVASAGLDLDPEILRAISRDSTTDLSRILNERLNAVPAFEYMVESSKSSVVELTSILGDLVGTDYHDTHDWSSPFAFPVNCTRVQTAVRFEQLIYYEPVIWSRLSNTQRMLIQLHEIIYFGGSKYFAMKSSRPTQDVISYLLSKRFTANGFHAILQRTGFFVERK